MELVTIARPYANAVFAIALSQNAMSKWSDLLQMAAMVVTDKRMKDILDDPKVSKEQKVDILSDLCKAHAPEKSRAFLHILAEKKRLILLPEIANMYETLKREYEKIMKVEIVSAKPLSTSEQDKLMRALEKRLARKVELDVTLNKRLLGGVVIRAGDLVINGSAKDKLLRLEQEMIR